MPMSVPTVVSWCWKCGHAEGEPDYAGCVGDFDNDHEYTDAAQRPYRDWDFDRLIARFMRASGKARSSEANWRHLVACPWRDDFAVAVYEQKAQQRYRIAAETLRELHLRSDPGLTGPTVRATGSG